MHYFKELPTKMSGKEGHSGREPRADKHPEYARIFYAIIDRPDPAGCTLEYLLGILGRASVKDFADKGDHLEYQREYIKKKKKLIKQLVALRKFGFITKEPYRGDADGILRYICREILGNLTEDNIRRIASSPTARKIIWHYLNRLREDNRRNDNSGLHQILVDVVMGVGESSQAIEYMKMARKEYVNRKIQLIDKNYTIFTNNCRLYFYSKNMTPRSNIAAQLHLEFTFEGDAAFQR